MSRFYNNTWMKWFFTKKATFKNADGDIDSDGLYSNSAIVETLTVDCDLQPVSRDDLIDDSGHFIDAQYKIYCYANPIIKQCGTLEYNGVEYEIKNIVDWDDYYIVLIKAVQ